MKDDDRKILTEFLGESIDHVWEIEGPTARCYQCGDVRDAESIPEAGPCRIRTFDTWEDFGALWNKAKESKGWQLFISKIYYAESSHHTIEANDYPGYIDVEQIDKDRFPPLVLEAIKEGVL